MDDLLLVGLLRGEALRVRCDVVLFSCPPTFGGFSVVLGFLMFLGRRLLAYRHGASGGVVFLCVSVRGQGSDRNSRK